MAQQRGWQPTRIAPSQAQPIQQAQRAPSSSVFRDDAPTGPDNVVIRWKSKPADSTNAIAVNRSQPQYSARKAFQDEPRGLTQATNQQYQNQQSPNGQARVQSGSGNPLRRDSGAYNRAATVADTYRSVPAQSVVYQAGQEDPMLDPFGDRMPANPQGGFPAFPPEGNVPPNNQGFPDPGALQQPNLGGAGEGLGNPALPGNQPNDAFNSPADSDPLSNPEAAPPPGMQRIPGAENDIMEFPPQQNPFPGADEAPSLSDLPQQDAADDDGSLRLPDQGSRDTNSLSCNDLRDRFLNRPLSVVKLNVSPKFGVGMRGVRKDTEDERLKFAAESKHRDWYNNAGELAASGRLIDLRNDNVILDVYGKARAIPLRTLSDLDLSYVGEAWNIPLKCGTGNASYEGRNYQHSVVQWKAPGHCHKPLYFEQPQLERYGHTVGPVLQPLISSAHFFTNIGIVPYKMGIHPPNECQYSLGYYRPGNCAPYMVQPFPWSLRGAAAQAGFVTGVGALIP